MLAAWKILDQEVVPHLPLPSSSRAVASPKQKKTALKEDGSCPVVISAPLSDLPTFQAANIWGKIFLHRRLCILD